MVRVLLSGRSLINLIVDSDSQPRFLTIDNREILWKSIESDALKLFVTDLTLERAFAICRKIGGNDWAKNFINRIKKDNEVCKITDEIIDKARLTNLKGLDFEDILDIESIWAYNLEGLVTDRPELFHKIPKFNCLTPTQLLQYLPVSIQVWADYSLKNRRDFTDWDLQEAELGDVNLAHSNFEGSALAGADFIGANLSGCNFTKADLSDIWGSEADFSGAILTQANLEGADLTSADFSNSDLTGANLARANLGKANFQGAKIANVDLSVVDLSETDTSAINLEGTKLEDYTVRNITNTYELKQVFQLQRHFTPTSDADFERLKDRWQAYPSGIKALFYQQKIVVGTVSLWALSEESASELEESIKSGQLLDADVEICSSRLLRRNQGSRHWYIDNVFLNLSLKSDENVNRERVGLLISEAFKIWRDDEDKYIQKHNGNIEIYSWETDVNILKSFPGVFPKQKFHKLPGQAEGRKLYKLSFS